MTDPLVSVVISTWKRLDLLQGAIASVEKQNYPNIELIVVDNASDDGTPEYLINKQVSGNVQHITTVLLDKPDPSAMKTLNMGFRKAVGKYILVLDDDAIMDDDNCLSTLVNDMESHPNLGLICPNVVSIDRCTQLLEYRDHPDKDDQVPFGRMYSYCGACALMRNDIFRDLGFYDESFVLYWNEADVNIKMLYSGWDVMYTNVVSATHLVSQKQRFMRKSLYYYLRNGNIIMNRTLSFKNRLYIITVRNIHLVYVISTMFEFDLMYLLKVLGVALHSMVNIFVMKGRYKPCNSDIFKETNENYMRIHLEENKGCTLSFWIPKIKNFLLCKVDGVLNGFR